MLSKITEYVKHNQHRLFIISCMALIAFIAYNLGSATATPKNQIEITDSANIYNTTINKTTPTPPIPSPKSTPRPSPKPIDSRVVASKNSKKYHYLLCPGVARILEANKIYFASAAEAENKGLILAGNCLP